jgi:hypothetical protein
MGVVRKKMDFFLRGLSAVIYNSSKHIRRTEDISLFPLPPHLSPASSFFGLKNVSKKPEV